MQTIRRAWTMMQPGDRCWRYIVGCVSAVFCESAVQETGSPGKQAHIRCEREAALSTQRPQQVRLHKDVSVMVVSLSVAGILP